LIGIVVFIVAVINAVINGITSEPRKKQQALTFEEEVLIVQQVIDEETDHKP